MFLKFCQIHNLLDNIEKKPNKKEEDEVKKDSMKIFIVLIVITLIGTLLASPAATLADTATLENLGNFHLQNKRRAEILLQTLIIAFYHFQVKKLIFMVFKDCGEHLVGALVLL